MAKKKHEDTSVSPHPLTIDEALKKAMDAGPLPKIIEALAIGNHPADS